MKREQIIHALYTRKVIGNIDLMELLEKAGYKDYSISAIIDRITDAILALPLDVPSDGDVLHESSIRFVSNTGYFNVTKATYFKKGATWMRDEIIYRNK